jgi:hypothetical protein
MRQKKPSNRQKKSSGLWRLPAPAGENGKQSGAPASPTNSGPFANAAAIGNSGVLNILSYYFSPLMPTSEFRIRTIIADNDYLEVPPDFVRNAIVTDPILSPQSYHADIFDCDDYVQYLKTKMSLYAATNRLPAPLAVGYLFTKAHAFSFCIGHPAKLYLINTQSDAVAINDDASSFRQFLSLRPDNNITGIYI